MILLLTVVYFIIGFVTALRELEKVDATMEFGTFMLIFSLWPIALIVIGWYKLKEKNKSKREKVKFPSAKEAIQMAEECRRAQNAQFIQQAEEAIVVSLKLGRLSARFTLYDFRFATDDDLKEIDDLLKNYFEPLGYEVSRKAGAFSYRISTNSQLAHNNEFQKTIKKVIQ